MQGWKSIFENELNWRGKKYVTVVILPNEVQLLNQICVMMHLREFEYLTFFVMIN